MKKSSNLASIYFDMHELFLQSYLALPFNFCYLIKDNKDTFVNCPVERKSFVYNCDSSDYSYDVIPHHYREIILMSWMVYYFKYYWYRIDISMMTEKLTKTL